jgi:hypothetical protein
MVAEDIKHTASFFGADQRIQTHVFNNKKTFNRTKLKIQVSKMLDEDLKHAASLALTDADHEQRRGEIESSRQMFEEVRVVSLFSLFFVSLSVLPVKMKISACPFLIVGVEYAHTLYRCAQVL